MCYINVIKRTDCSDVVTVHRQRVERRKLVTKDAFIILLYEKKQPTLR